jgi:hypothetical protein
MGLQETIYLPVVFNKIFAMFQTENVEHIKQLSETVVVPCIPLGVAIWFNLNVNQVEMLAL